MQALEITSGLPTHSPHKPSYVSTTSLHTDCQRRIKPALHCIVPSGPDPRLRGEWRIVVSKGELYLLNPTGTKAVPGSAPLQQKLGSSAMGKGYASSKAQAY